MGFGEEIKKYFEELLNATDFTSASPAYTNKVKQINPVPVPDFDRIISESDTSTEDTKQKKKQKKIEKTVEGWDKGSVGEVSRFSTQQMGNLKGFVDDPATFIIQGVFKKFAKGVGIIAFAAIIFEAVKFIISDLLKPGRLLDIRFKRDINKEIIAFRRREDQQRLKQGFSNIIITTQPRLRGGTGAQVFNTLNAAAGRVQFPDNIGASSILLQASGVSLSKSRGKRSFGGPGR